MTGTSGGRIQGSQFLPGKRETHYAKHRDKFKEPLSEEEYEEQARQFFGKPVTKDILWFEDKVGYLYKYDKKKIEFGICSPDGVIITYYIPDDGITYWYREVQKHGF